MTDEELENIKLMQCPSCNSKMTSVRHVSQRWWYVGCVDCFNKIMCEREFVERAAEKFNDYARRCRGVRTLAGIPCRHSFLLAGVRDFDSLGENK